MPKTRNQNIALLHLIVFIWGFTAILGALISLDSIPLVWYRMLLATVFIGVYLLFKKQSLKVNSKTLLKLFIAGSIIAVHWVTFFAAIKVSNVSVALITMSTGAFFGSLIEPIFFKRRVYKFEVFLGLIVILALYLIFKEDGGGQLNPNYLLGVIYGLISAFLAAVFSVVNGVMVKKHRPTMITFYELGFGVVFLSIYILFTDGFGSDFFNLEATDWYYLILLASVCTAFAFIMSVKVMKVLSPYTVMLTTNLEPVYGILLAVLIFGEKEHMDLRFYFGAVVILIVVLSNGVLKNALIKKRK
ncbi:DMT family transporter [Flavobacteriaceae bacterium]|nr:DMT family transporter [Flavobacteriaceae bacterium]